MITTDTTGFRAMCKELEKLSGKPFPEVVRHQVAKVFETAIKYTPSVNVQKATLSAQNHIRRKYNTYARGRAGSKDQYVAGRVFESAAGSNPRISRSNGNIWWKDGQRFYHMGGKPLQKQGVAAAVKRFFGGDTTDGFRHWNSARWAAYEREESERKLDLEEALADVAAGIRRSRGLGKQSWLDGLAELGLDKLVKCPDYARKAMGANRRKYKNGTGKDESGMFRTLLVITNTSPLMANKNQGVSILSRAISTRLKAFETDVSNKVFEDVKTRAQRYPGLFVTR